MFQIISISKSFLLHKINLQIYFSFFFHCPVDNKGSLSRKTKQNKKHISQQQQKKKNIELVLLHLKYQGSMLKRIPRYKFPIL